LKRLARHTRTLALCAATLFAARLLHAAPPALKTTELGRGPVVVFVPGLGITRQQWMPTARKLVGTHRVVMVDLPGQGDSPLADPFSFDACAQALDAVLAKEKPESTIVVAHSVGGVVAMRALAATPGRAAGLLLIDTQVKSPFPIPDQQRQQMVQFIEGNYDNFLKMAFANMGRDSAESALLFTQMAQTPPATIKTYLRSLLALDANKDAKAVQPVTRLLVSERGWREVRTPGAVMASLGFEDTSAYVPTRLGGAGYLAMKDQPDSLAAIIKAFSAERLAARQP